MQLSIQHFKDAVHVSKYSGGFLMVLQIFELSFYWFYKSYHFVIHIYMRFKFKFMLKVLNEYHCLTIKICLNENFSALFIDFSLRLHVHEN